MAVTDLHGTPVTNASVLGSFDDYSSTQATLTTARAARAALVTTCNTKTAAYADALAAYTADPEGVGLETDLNTAIDEKNTADDALDANAATILGATRSLTAMFMPAVVARLQASDGSSLTDPQQRSETVDAKKLKDVVALVIEMTALMVR